MQGKEKELQRGLGVKDQKNRTIPKTFYIWVGNKPGLASSLSFSLKGPPIFLLPNKFSADKHTLGNKQTYRVRVVGA